MIGSCKECIKDDAQFVKPLVALFNEFPEYNDEQKARMMEILPGIIRRYGELMDHRFFVVEAIDPLVENDLKNIQEEMTIIEQQYPEETAAYSEELDQYPTKKQNDDDRNTEA